VQLQQVLGRVRLSFGCSPRSQPWLSLLPSIPGSTVSHHVAFRKPVGHWDAFAPTTDSAMSFPFSPVPRQGRPGERPLRAPSTQDRRVSLLVVYLAGTIRHVELRLSLCRLDRRGEGVNVVGAVLAATFGEGRRGASHSAGAGRVDVIGHPVGTDTYAGR
jgi:hypothetical protein